MHQIPHSLIAAFTPRLANRIVMLFCIIHLVPGVFAALPEPEVSTEYTAQIYEIDGLTTRWVGQPVNDLTVGYDLQLLSVAGVGGLPSAGTSLVVIALTGSELHIRVFDDTGATVVDKAESELTDPPARTFLKTLLQRDPFPVVAELPEEEKKSILGKATALTDYPSPYDYPIVDSIVTPSYSDEANLIYADNPEFFNIASKAGYGSGLGILSEANLPPIQFVGDMVKIRSNTVVKSKTIRQFTATSNDATEFAADLLLIVDGQIGYELDAGDPYAFERQLTGEIGLVVRVHREDGSVETVWEAGAVMTRFNDVDLPFNAFGDWNANDWKVNGTVATLNLFEHISTKFTVQNGETFAVEFELTARTLNYEQPNSTAFVRMLNTADFRIIPSEPDAILVAINPDPPGMRYTNPIRVNTAKSNIEYPDEIFLVENSLKAFGSDINSISERPPSIFPTAADSVSKVVEIPWGEAVFTARDVATVFHNAPGGQLGGEVRAEFYTFEPQRRGGDWYGGVLSVKPIILSRYLPVVEGTLLNPIDIDFRVIFDGVIEFRAPSFDAYLQLMESDLLMEYTLWGGISTRYSSKAFGAGDESKFKAIALNPKSIDIQNENGQLVGNRLLIDIDTDETSGILNSVSLEDILLIDAEDYVEVVFQLNIVFRGLSSDLGEVLEYVSLDFNNTFKGSIATDTPGVTFVIADSPEVWDAGSQLQVQKVDLESVVIGWPSEGVGELQKSGNLDSNSWEPVDLPPQDNGVMKTLIVPVGTESQFYRLNPSTPTESGVEGRSQMQIRWRRVKARVFDCTCLPVRESGNFHFGSKLPSYI
jgi:hypothetical protein